MRDRMNRASRVRVWVSLLSLLLSACTGSQEPLNPVLLLTGFQRPVAGSAPTNHVGIIQDSLDSGDSERLTFLPESVRELPAPSVAYDVTNRENARNTLVVLSRGGNNAAGAPGYLSFFTTSGLRSDDISGFKLSRELVINDISGLDIIPRNFPNRDAPFYCPSKIQVTQGGNYAAVLNVPRLCGAGVAQNFIDILDLDVTGTGRLLQRISGVAEGGIYMSQGSAEDILYYAVEGPRSLIFNAATMPRPGQAFGPDDTLSLRPDFATVTRQLSQGTFIDLGVSGQPGSDRLVVLFEQGIAYVSGYTGEGTEAEPVTTLENDNAQVIRDDLRRTDATLVLARPESDRFSYFSPTSSTDEDDNPVIDEERDDVDADAAVTEMNSGYVYFVASGRVSLFDLESYDTGESLRTQAFPVEGLTAPNFVTWAQALPPLAAP